MNVFRKCLKKEFGQSDYLRYFSMCQEEMQEEAAQELQIRDKAVYQEMMHRLRNLRPEEIQQKRILLSDTLIQAIQIGRQFWFVFIFYVIASLVLIALQLQTVVTNVSLVLMGICFLYKTYEFVCNKYCIVDAYMMMLYQSALEQTAA